MGSGYQVRIVNAASESAYAGKAALPFFAFPTCIEHVVGVPNLEDLGREDAVTVPHPALGRWRKDGIVGIRLKAAEVPRADMPDLPGSAIVPAVQDMKIARPFEDFRLADAVAVPRLAAACEYGIGGVFADGRGVAGRNSLCGNMQIEYNQC